MILLLLFCNRVSGHWSPPGFGKITSLISSLLDIKYLVLSQRGSKINADGDCSHKIKRLAPWKKNDHKPRQQIKKKIRTLNAIENEIASPPLLFFFGNLILYSQSYGFSSRHIWKWSGAWQPTPVFLPGESPRTKEPGGYGPWGHKESDMTE